MTTQLRAVVRASSLVAAMEEELNKPMPSTSQPTTDHERMEDLVAAFALDACDAEEAERVRAHVAACASCCALAGRLSTLVALPPPTEVGPRWATDRVREGIPRAWGEGRAAQRSPAGCWVARSGRFRSIYAPATRPSTRPTWAWCTSWQEWARYLFQQLASLPDTAWVYRRERRRESVR
jgi:Putative zinc-finger